MGRRQVFAGVLGSGRIAGGKAEWGEQIIWEGAMGKKQLDEGWSEMGEDIVAGVIGWRLKHPKATLQEIEAAGSGECPPGSTSSPRIRQTAFTSHQNRSANLIPCRHC